MLCLDETSILSPDKDRGRGVVPTGVRTTKDVLHCVLKSYRRVSIVGANVFFNWTELSPIDSLMGLPDIRSRYLQQSERGMGEN